jgi:hypothetical protein
VELKLAWATFPTHAAALAAGATVVGVGLYVPFAAPSFPPGSLFWLVPAEADTEARQHYAPPHVARYDALRAAAPPSQPQPPGTEPKHLRACARVHAVLGRLSADDHDALARLARLESELVWTAARLHELAAQHGTVTLFALEVFQAGKTQTLPLRRVHVAAQLGVRPLDPGELERVLPADELQRRAAAVRAALAGPGAAPASPAAAPADSQGLLAPTPTRSAEIARTQPAQATPRAAADAALADVQRALAEAEARARAAEASVAELELELARVRAGLPGASAVLDGLDGGRGHANGAAHAAQTLAALKQRIAADVEIPDEWCVELQELCDLALESPRHAVVACRRLLGRLLGAAHLHHCRTRSAAGFQARADDLRSAGCISDLTRRWLLALWDIGTAAMQEDVRGWAERDAEAVVLGTWRVLSAEHETLCLPPLSAEAAAAADGARRNGAG